MIAFDIDGCVNCIKEDIIHLGRSFFKDNNIGFNPKGYYLREIWTGADESVYQKFWETHGYSIYTNSPREGFSDVVRYLRDNGINACYITTRDIQKSFEGIPFDDLTINWLKEYDIELPVYYRTDKDAAAKELNVELIVEDKPSNIIKLQKVTRVIIFDHPYNAHLVGERVFGWFDVLKLIKKLQN